MKVAFLDLDGVLVTNETINFPLVSVKGDENLPRKRLGYSQFDQSCVKCLNEITKQTGAVIVVSSSHRILYDIGDWYRLKRHLKGQGVEAPIIDRTPVNGPTNKDGEKTRGMEIQAWLNDHPEVDKFVIIDDDNDMDHLEDHLVLTMWEGGLKEEHIELAVNLLTD